MSAIAGIFRRDGAPVDEAELQRMVDAMKRRGPDRSGTWGDGCVGFGHGALFSTLEAERENQPCTLDGQVWITADARIDGWDDLRPKLAAKGCRLSEAPTDAELILHAYAVWGENCVEHLIGEFAFVIWDARKQQMLCVRDHFGNRTFYVHMTDTLFAFASDAGALLTLPDIPRRINEGRIADYLVDFLEGIDFTSTFFEGIERLPPATCRVVTRDRHVDRKYWSLDPTREIRFGTDKEYVEAFLDVFTKAVSDRLRTPERVGSMLSGGIDSSSVVGVARRLLQQRGLPPLPTFSAVSIDDQNIETQIIRVAQQMDHLKVHDANSHGVAHNLAEIDALYTETFEPFDNAMLIPQLMYLLAKRSSLKVILDGMGGDNVVTLGGDHLQHLLRAGMIWEGVSEARGLGRLYHRFGETTWRTLARSAKVAFMPRWLRQMRTNSIRRRRTEIARHKAFISTEFARQIDLENRVATFDQRTSARTLREDHVSRLIHPYLTVALERYDRVAAFDGIEARHPYQDIRFVEFCVALDWTLKDYRGWSKVLNRRAMKGILPDEVIWAQPRQNLSVEYWIARNQAAVTKHAAVLDGNFMSVLLRYVDVDRARKECLQGWDADATSDPGVWTLYGLSRWISAHVDPVP